MSANPMGSRDLAPATATIRGSRNAAYRHQGQAEAQDSPTRRSGRRHAGRRNRDDARGPLHPRHRQGKADPGRSPRRRARPVRKGRPGRDGSQSRRQGPLREIQRHQHHARGGRGRHREGLRHPRQARLIRERENHGCQGTAVQFGGPHQAQEGHRRLAEAVKVTLGPKRRNVVIDKKFGSPTITKDGVTVAKEIELSDAIENMGAQMVKEVATKTSDLAGDGTTTATVLAQAIFREGLKNVTAGANPMELKRGIEKAVEAVVEEFKRLSKTTSGKKEIAQVGSISANNDPEIEPT